MKMRLFSLSFVLLFHANYENENFNCKRNLIMVKIEAKQSDFKYSVSLRIFRFPFHINCFNDLPVLFNIYIF